MNESIRELVKQTVKQHRLKDVNPDTLTKLAEKYGYTVIMFNNVYNDDNVSAIIDNLNIAEYISKSRGFTYADKNYRLIFVNEDLNDDEKAIVLSHELGHIVCNHMGTHPVIGNDIIEEYEANEFSHYILKNNEKRFLGTPYSKRLLINVIIVVAMLIGSFISGWCIRTTQVYHGKYYVTKTGDRYHKNGCVYLSGKTNFHRFSEEEFETGLYTPCNVCLPEE